ncbi:MAG: hypothetical protein WC657_03750 [Candidatus Paceibacterota bacterium]|jgi:hypothetical protein
MIKVVLAAKDGIKCLYISQFLPKIYLPDVPDLTFIPVNNQIDISNSQIKRRIFEFCGEIDYGFYIYREV